MDPSSTSPNHTSSPDPSTDHARKNNPSSSSSQAATASGLNPRSCVTCRRRKVRCNKQYPCSNCLKAHTECIFPAPGRAARRPRKPPDGELLARLRRLEGVIQNLGVTVDEDGTQIDTGAGPGAGAGAVAVDLPKDQTAPNPPNQPRTTQEKTAQNLNLESTLGRLVVNEGRSRYVNNRFWASLSEEVADLKGILDETSEDEGDVESPTSTDIVSTPSDVGFIFNFQSIAHDLHSFHPPKPHIEELWRVYKESCDPVLKLGHVPSIEKQLITVATQPGKAHRSMEAFMFAMYFAAVTAMQVDECRLAFGESRDVLVKRYRFATEQALARANFIISEELLTLQAFMVFLTCLRRHEDGRVLWTLVGIMERVAVSMGIHRDGKNFGLSPFETEMRRRTYWQTVLLDIRSSQDSGIEPIVISIPSDVEMPSNVNDDDLDPGMTSFPQARIGVTDVTFCNLRYDMSKTLCKLFYSSDATLQDKERWVTECHQYLDRTYFKYCDMSKSFDWCIATVAKLIMARHFLLLYHPIMRTLPPETLDRLFVTSLEVLEFGYRLENERRMVKFGWLLKTYNHWHALAFVLSELTRRTKGPLVQRAWRAVNNSIQEFRKENTDKKRGHLWKPLEKLLNMAKVARERELAQESQLLQAAAVNATMSNAMNDVKAPGSDFSAIPNVQGMGVQSAQGGFEGATASDSNDASMGNSLLSLPALEPTISHRSNPIDDKYMADNVWTNNVPLQSQFFANQPISWLDTDGNEQTLDTATIDMNNANLAEWFGGWDINSFNPATTDINSTTNVNTANAPAMAGPQPGLAADPMVSGSDMPDSQWMDWEEMMKEFELESGRTPGASQWQRQTLLGGSWF